MKVSAVSCLAFNAFPYDALIGTINKDIYKDLETTSIFICILPSIHC